MSKKHFIAFADFIRDYQRSHADYPFSGEQIEALADFCHSQNGDFMRERWLGYIAGTNGPNGGPTKTRTKGGKDETNP